MTTTKTIRAADLFCGAGGSSTGLNLACKELGLDLELIAVNHWDVAIRTHSRNHPGAKHVCEELDTVSPRKLVPGGRLNLLIASPPCQHHSRARGGKPMSDQMRSSAWRILDWATDLYIDNILMENVQEWQEWGPLGVDGRPLKSKKGETFQAFLTGLRGLGYRVEYRVLNAANYGDPTTRERLFIICRRGNKSISWPDPTHAKDSGSQSEMFPDRKRWTAAREIIDWTIEGKSIFTRKKDLAPATMRRIAAGLRKFGGANAEPFLVILRNHGGARSLDEPLPTVTASGKHSALCEPFVLGQQSSGAPRSVDDPVPTVASAGAIALVEPFVVEMRNGKTVKSLNDPLSTVTTKGAHHGLVEPFVVQFNGNRERDMDRSKSIEDPLGTVTAGGNRFGVVEPFILPQFSEGVPRSVERPLGTVTTTSRGVALIEPFVEPLLMSYYGNGDTTPVSQPVPTVTTKDRFALIVPDKHRIDIRFRMLQPRELARAQGFPDDYVFTGNREDTVKQIGNAVCVGVAKALCLELLK